ncbi:hypothetical protein Tco_1522657 [Tanacetum coccineum]
MENPNSPNESNEAIPEVNPVIPEPNHVEDAHDPNEMVDIPDDEELDIEDEDVEIEVDDAAELIFPYEVEGDQTSTPRDESSNSEPPNAESSDSVSSDSELEDKEADIAHRPTGGTATQRPFAIRISRGISEKEKRYLIMDLGNVEKTLSNVVERLKILESEENATLKKKGFLDVFYGRWFLKEAVPEAALRYEDDGRPKEEVKEVGLRMNGPFEPRGPPISRTSLLELYNIRWIMPPKPMSEAHMREIIKDQVTTSINEFMANMNHGASGAGAGGARSGGAGAGGDGAGGAGAGGAGAGGAGAGGAGADGAGIGGAGPVEAEVTGCTYMTFMKEKDKVKFATATLQGRALTWWNRRTASMGIVATNGTPWAEVRKWMAEEMVEPEQVKVEQYIRGLSKNIRGDVISSQPATIDHVVHMAYQLMGQIIQDKTDEVHEGEKRKGEGDRGGRGDNRRDYNNRQNQRRANAGAMTNAVSNDKEVCLKCKNKKHNGDCWKCSKCGKLGHKTAACRCHRQERLIVINCNKKCHLKEIALHLRRNGQDGNNRRAVYKLGAMDAQEDPKVVTGSLKKFKKRIPEVLKPRSKDTRRTSGNTTRNDPFPPFLIIEAQTQVIEQVAARSGMDSKMAELTMSSPNRFTSDIDDAFSSMNILNYTSVSPDYFPASSESSSFNSLENSKDNMIQPVFSSFYNNPCLKDVQAFYTKELPISPSDPITSPAILTLLLFDPRYFFVPEELLPPKKRICSLSSSSTTLSNPSRNQTHKVEDILNYLDELSLRRIKKIEEGRINGNKLKTKLKGIRTQIIRLQKERLGQKDKISFSHYRIYDLE